MKDPECRDRVQNLTNVEWNLMHIYKQVFECMFDASKLLSGQRYPTASQHLPTLIGLIELITEYKNDAEDYDAKMMPTILKQQIKVKKKAKSFKIHLLSS